MGLLNPLLLGARRYAAGVDVHARGVTLVVLSQRVFGGGPLRIEWLGRVPLAREALAGAEIVDRAALVTALQAAFGAMPRACAEAALRCAMALPTGATLMASVPLARLSPRPPGIAGAPFVADVSGLFTELEPLVLAEAERVAGIERHELSVDWRVGPLAMDCGVASTHEAKVMIAATARAYLESRIECAAMAGVALCVMDDEAHAALRAMRHAAAFELPPHEPWAALWVGADGVHGWFVADDSIARTMHFPALEHADLVEALRDLAGSEQTGCAIVAGDVGLLQGVHFSIADIGDVLGCPVLPFECAPLADADFPLDAQLLHDPACAVAFGLAMRGVHE
ncbi:Tfp pilus assembly PilM family ATPase [Paraburkholderia bannensis]|uniref:Tfp pilus assembly PilM family ATPase n=1 Tax=Paraburkholderia bannensis TaxID=765414 RepID=A0A7W9U1T2_9BURK|nr:MULTISPECIES: pilus assembly protein PilM [Paraburkholderia]MBB3260446.1 Tfp pilus assembly PilM family ATPase [Paraburkholderia sp. WP4_3_2]MBB6105482.1 Tfp pilus assembly PilM family ATPase [Paraburkholderia bannensis]